MTEIHEYRTTIFDQLEAVLSFENLGWLPSINSYKENFVDNTGCALNLPDYNDDLLGHLLANNYQSRMRLLKDKCILNNEDEIDFFIRKTPNLLKHVIGAYELINEMFSENIQYIKICYSQDPEEQSEILTFIIHTALGVDHSLQLLEQFDNKWLNIVNPPAIIQQSLVITLE